MFNISNLQPWECGDYATLSAWENDQEAKVEQMICYFSNKIVYRDLVTQYMKQHDIEYRNLPNYLVKRIDTIRVY